MDIHQPEVPAGDAPAQSGHERAGQAPPWRAPTVTRLSIARTLFSHGSPTDLGGSGSTGG